MGERTWREKVMESSSSTTRPQNMAEDEKNNVTIKLIVVDLKAKLSKFFNLSVKDMNIEDSDGSDISGWCGVLACVTLSCTKKNVNAVLDTHVPQRDVSVKLELPRTSSRHDVETMVATIFGFLPNFIQVKIHKGSSWVPHGAPVNRPTHVTCAVERVSRGDTRAPFERACCSSWHLCIV